MSAPAVVQELLKRVGDLQKKRKDDEQMMKEWQDEKAALDRQNSQLQMRLDKSNTKGQENVQEQVARAVAEIVKTEFERLEEAWRIASLFNMAVQPQPPDYARLPQIDGTAAKKLDEVVSNVRQEVKKKCDDYYKAITTFITEANADDVIKSESGINKENEVTVKQGEQGDQSYVVQVAGVTKYTIKFAKMPTTPIGGGGAQLFEKVITGPDRASAVRELEHQLGSRLPETRRWVNAALK